MKLLFVALCLGLAAAAPGPQTFPKDVVMEQTLKVKGFDANGDVDILEVDHNSNLKGDVRVGQDLNVVQNAAVGGTLSVTDSATVGANLNVDGSATVGGTLGVEGDSTFGSNIIYEALDMSVSAASNLALRLFTGGSKRALADYITYKASTGEWSINGGKVKYSPVTGTDVNDGSMTIDSKNGDTELDIRNVGETTLQRKTSSKCALLLEEHPDNAVTTHDLMVVKGRTRFRDQMRVVAPPSKKRTTEPLLVVEGDMEVTGTVESPGNVKDYEAVVATQAVVGNLTVGESHSVTASCTGNKKVTGGGCDIYGGNSFGLVQRRSHTNSLTDAMECEFLEVFEDANDIDATISATVFCITSV
jgi:hypothetical protein